LVYLGVVVATTGTVNNFLYLVQIVLQILLPFPNRDALTAHGDWQFAILGFESRLLAE
jgi:hypothetical protein